MLPAVFPFKKNACGPADNDRIILCVSAATTDLAQDRAIGLAKQSDPTGERTIGVITKVDLIAMPGSGRWDAHLMGFLNAIDQNFIKWCNKGYVLVRCSIQHIQAHLFGLACSNAVEQLSRIELCNLQ